MGASLFQRERREERILRFGIDVPEWWCVQARIGGSIVELNVIAIDIAKKVFQLHWVELDTVSSGKIKLQRSQMLK